MLRLLLVDSAKYPCSVLIRRGILVARCSRLAAYVLYPLEPPTSVKFE
jgi:hypothetical protein